jgi:hypothetical protein
MRYGTVSFYIVTVITGVGFAYVGRYTLRIGRFVQGKSTHVNAKPAR